VKMLQVTTMAIRPPRFKGKSDLPPEHDLLSPPWQFVLLLVMRRFPCIRIEGASNIPSNQEEPR